jgi:hypothetical protein
MDLTMRSNARRLSRNARPQPQAARLAKSEPQGLLLVSGGEASKIQDKSPFFCHSSVAKGMNPKGFMTEP